MTKPISDTSKTIKHLIHGGFGVGLTEGDHRNIVEMPRPKQPFLYPSADPEYKPDKKPKAKSISHFPRPKHEPTSIANYKKIHAAGYYLNRLCRRLHIEEPDDPLMREAIDDARHRFTEVQPEASKILANDLPAISIQVCKVREKLPEIEECAASIIQGKCNAEIWKAIRRVEKTKAYLALSYETETEKQRRRIFQKDVERYHRGLTRAIRKDDLIVPRHWPMHWANGAYAPINTPHEWRPKRKKTLHQIETGKKINWARLTRNLRTPPPGWNPRPLAAEKQEERGHKMVGALIRRQARKDKYLNDSRFAGIRSGQFRGSSVIMKVEGRKP